MGLGESKDGDSGAGGVRGIANPINELQLLEGHRDIVRFLIRIDDQRIVSGGDDGKAVVWDCRTGERLFTLDGHSLPITGLLFAPRAPSGVLVTGSSDKTVRMWNVDPNTPPPERCIAVLQGHTGSITCLASIDSQRFCSGGNDRTIILWSVANGSLLSRIERQEEENLHCLLPISKGRLVTGSNSSFLYVYDTDKAKHQLLAYHRESVRCLIKISDALFASASLDGAIVIWHTSSLSPLKTLTYPEHYLDTKTRSFTFSVRKLQLFNNRFLAAAIGNGFRIFDVESGDCVFSCENAHEGVVTDMIPLYSCSRIATCSTDGALRIWGCATQRPVPSLFSDENLAKSNLLLTARRRDDTAGVCLGEMWCHSDAVYCLLQLSETSFASCGCDGMIILWKDGRVQTEHRNNTASASLKRNNLLLRSSGIGGAGESEESQDELDDATAPDPMASALEHLRPTRARSRSRGQASSIAARATSSGATATSGFTAAPTAQGARLRMAQEATDEGETDDEEFHDSEEYADPDGKTPDSASSASTWAAANSATTIRDQHATKPIPDVQGVTVPEYIFDYAVMLRNEKKYSIEQICESMREMGHSDTIIQALVQKL